MDIKTESEKWLERNARLPICSDMTRDGNFTYQLFGMTVGFAFGMAGRVTTCYWLKDLEKFLYIPDAYNQYVTPEKLDSLVQWTQQPSANPISTESQDS